MIEIHDLTNKFNDRTAVNGISSQVKEGKADALERRCYYKICRLKFAPFAFSEEAWYG